MFIFITVCIIIALILTGKSVKDLFKGLKEGSASAVKTITKGNPLTRYENQVLKLKGNLVTLKTSTLTLSSQRDSAQKKVDGSMQLMKKAKSEENIDLAKEAFGLMKSNQATVDVLTVDIDKNETLQDSLTKQVTNHQIKLNKVKSSQARKAIINSSASIRTQIATSIIEGDTTLDTSELDMPSEQELEATACEEVVDDLGLKNDILVQLDDQVDEDEFNALYESV
jgi:hypothetical protein